MTNLRAACAALLIGVPLAACGESTIQMAPRRVEADLLVRVPVEEVAAEAEPAPETGRPAPTMLALGNEHSCALTEDGGVYCWGSNYRGQLGDIGDRESAIPSRVPGLGEMDAVWAGYEMTCAREAGNGTLHCWGDTGLSAHPEPGFATPLPFQGVHTMALGYRMGCFQDESHVFCWGDYGRPHGPIFDAPQRVNTGGLSGLVAGEGRHCGLDPRGRIVCWGSHLAYWRIERLAEPLWRVEGLEGVQQMALPWGPQARPWIVDRHGHVQRTDVGGEDRRRGYHSVDLHRVAGVDQPASLVAGGSHACARMSNGTAACWGFNSHGQVGDGTTAERQEARVLTLTEVEEIAAGGQHTCARAGGRLFCWGANGTGQVGAASPSSIYEPTEVPW